MQAARTSMQMEVDAGQACMHVACENMAVQDFHQAHGVFKLVQIN